jgi:DNA-binding protein H-NS
LGRHNLSAFGIYSYIDLSLGDKQMPKPNLSSMSVDALLKLREDIDQAVDRKASELRSQLSMLGRPTIQRGSRLKGRKVPPKYRSPSGETWAGRGARPRWLVAALKRGKKVEHFLIRRK